MAAKPGNEACDLEQNYLYLAGVVCGDDSPPGLPKELCREAKKSLSAAEWQDRRCVLDEMIRLKDRFDSRHDQPTTEQAAQHLLGDLVAWPQTDWIPFADLLGLLGPILQELILLDRLTLGVFINGWQRYEPVASLVYDVALPLFTDRRPNATTRYVDDVMEPFCRNIVSQISPRTYNSDWITKLVLARDAESDVATFHLVRQALNGDKDGTDSEVIKDKLANLLRYRANDARKKLRRTERIKPSMFIQDQT